MAWYQDAARAAIPRSIRGAEAILSAARGLYVSSVLWDFPFPPRDEALRAPPRGGARARGPGCALRAAPRGRSPCGGEHRPAQRATRGARARGAGPGRPDARRLPSGCAGGTVASVDAYRDDARGTREQLVSMLDERVEGMWAAGLVDEVRGCAAKTRARRHGVTSDRVRGRRSPAARRPDARGGHRADAGPHPAVRAPTGVVVSAVTRCRVVDAGRRMPRTSCARQWEMIDGPSRSAHSCRPTRTPSSPVGRTRG